jgi:hypothetical protein
MLTLHQPIPEHNPLSHCCPGVHLEQAVPLMYGSSKAKLMLSFISVVKYTTEIKDSINFAFFCLKYEKASKKVQKENIIYST